MKAILEFDLPEDRAEHAAAVNGSKWKALLWEIDQWLRGIAKHGSDQVKVSEVRERIYEEMRDDNLSFED